ncbi:methylhydantoinase [Rhodococcus sp. 15-725-2-2b]|uniref:hydantoinase B/oxoprolinase family protein n=1 Tax=unclassified Rhodococcus (in: high G+C Gram-positive bacteria) TaxID=192944 RepID=UPI000B9C6C1C|nr:MULTISPECIES: hydantoinase B/oxoprolinase family protein [unclassified Rhodococcus (in: high G+C Gram-positive bacteria)]OZC63542.1 methylhydantoinase [Rhodococcus sp. 06-469-3-2]OZD40707.1 methylhydantoinase [Rhodococcus sp. 06-1477-1A]OZE67185.1 methylhydantoinase [Rhodococcus sp. 15-725-2-2b]
MTLDITAHPTEPVTLKTLDDAAFDQRYGTDRFTASILGNRMRYIVEHMCTGLLHNAFSIILRDWYDFAATISGPPETDYSMPAVSKSMAVFFGTMADAVRNTVIEFGVENLRPGDVLVGNDPYRAGTHVNDVCFIRPVFHKDRIVAFVNLRAHQLDMGGPVPGGFSSTKRNSYETGMVLSPRLLYRDDQPIRSAFDLIFDNARFGALLLPDIKTIYQNLRLGERLIHDSIARYGSAALRGAIDYACDTSAEAMSSALRALPDGIYSGEDGIDADTVADDREYRVKVRVVKAGNNVELDFSDSSPQARTSINCGAIDAKMAVGVALKFLVDPSTPFTSGTYRNIDLVIPPATFLSATPPDGAIFMYFEAAQAVLLAVFRALEPAVGDRAVGGDYCSLSLHNAGGVTDSGEPWVNIAQCGGEHGPWGATRDGDADSYNVFYISNNMDPATEAIEAEVPAVILRKEYVADTAGSGYNRGGAAVRKDTLWLTGAEHLCNPLHFKTPSGHGVQGGQDGSTGAIWLFDGADRPTELIGTDTGVYRDSTVVSGRVSPDTLAADSRNGVYQYFGRQQSWQAQANAIFRYLTNGGGGWGDSFSREPERVRDDVRDGYVTIDGAARDYGVVISGDPETDPEGLTIDLPGTEALRAATTLLQ